MTLTSLVPTPIPNYVFMQACFFSDVSLSKQKILTRNHLFNDIRTHARPPYPPIRWKLENLVKNDSFNKWLVTALFKNAGNK